MIKKLLLVPLIILLFGTALWAKVFFSDPEVVLTLWESQNIWVFIDTEWKKISATDIVVYSDSNFIELWWFTKWSGFSMYFKPQQKWDKTYYTAVSTKKYLSWIIYFGDILLVPQKTWTTYLKFVTDGFWFQHTKETNIAYDGIDLLKSVIDAEISIISWNNNSEHNISNSWNNNLDNNLDNNLNNKKILFNKTLFNKTHIYQILLFSIMLAILILLIREIIFLLKKYKKIWKK